MEYYLFTYFCIVVFALSVGHLVFTHLRLPVHLRWEIYPVQHETSDRASYGGSYMEGLDWWEKKREGSFVNEITYMVPEIVLLRGLWKENRPLWYVSFPFHFGLYLMIAVFVILVLHALITLWAGAAFAVGTTFRTIMDGLILVAGWTGMIFGVAGGVGMLYKRLSDRAMRAYATPMDYFNILFIFAFFLCAFLSCLLFDPFMEGSKAYVAGLVSAGALVRDYAPGQTVTGALTIVFASLLVAYIPLTHMSHMFMKYFLYHKVKWDDVPSGPGSRVESAVVKNLQLKPTWKAGHINVGGEKSWKELAVFTPEEKQ